MTREEIFAELRLFLQDRLDVDEDQLTMDARYVEDLGADPLDLVEIVMDLETALQVSIPDEDAEKLTTIGATVDYIWSHRDNTRDAPVPFPVRPGRDTTEPPMDPILGQIQLFAIDFAPRGWMRCDGRMLPINQYGDVFSLVGTKYGGNGVTNFALPDLTGKEPVPGSMYCICVKGVFPSRD